MKYTRLLGIVSMLLLIAVAIATAAIPDIELSAQQKEDASSVEFFYDYLDGYNYTIQIYNSTDQIWSDIAGPGTANNNEYYEYTNTQTGVGYRFRINISNSSAQRITNPTNQVFINDNPNITSIVASPTSIDPDDNVLCTVNVTDIYQPTTGIIKSKITLYYGNQVHNSSTMNCAQITDTTFSCARTFYAQDLDGNYSRGNAVYCQATANDQELNATQKQSNTIILDNRKPVPTTVQVTEIDAVEPTLYCNFTYTDPDGDTEDIAQRTFKWYVNNENLNNWLELPEFRSQTLRSGFDQDDRIR